MVSSVPGVNCDLLPCVLMVSICQLPATAADLAARPAPPASVSESEEVGSKGGAGSTLGDHPPAPAGGAQSAHEAAATPQLLPPPPGKPSPWPDAAPAAEPSPAAAPAAAQEAAQCKSGEGDVLMAEAGPPARPPEAALQAEAAAAPPSAAPPSGGGPGELASAPLPLLP